MYLKSFINQYFPGAGAVGGSMLLRLLTPNFSNLNSSAELVDDRSLPLYEVALLYMLACIGNESQIEREVVDAGYLHRQEFLCLEEVVQVCLAGNLVDFASVRIHWAEVHLPFLLRMFMVPL